MKLPNHERAVVSQRKVVDYLLSFSHPSGRHKAAFFGGFGFSASSWRVFAGALLRHATQHEAAIADASPFGTRYTIEGELDSPDGRRPFIRTVWFVERGKDVPRLVTAYPVKRGR